MSNTLVNDITTTEVSEIPDTYAFWSVPEPDTDEALRHNDGKPPLGQLLPFDNALAMLAYVLEQGGIKYKPRNWLKGGKPDSEYIDAALRHLVRFAEGEEYDPETGCHHLAHAAWNMLALLRCNRHGAPLMDPDFDQDAFLARWSGPTVSVSVEPEPMSQADRLALIRGGLL